MHNKLRVLVEVGKRGNGSKGNCQRGLFALSVKVISLKKIEAMMTIY